MCSSIHAILTTVHTMTMRQSHRIQVNIRSHLPFLWAAASLAHLRLRAVLLATHGSGIAAGEYFRTLISSLHSAVGAPASEGKLQISTYHVNISACEPTCSLHFGSDDVNLIRQQGNSFSNAHWKLEVVGAEAR